MREDAERFEHIYRVEKLGIGISVCFIVVPIIYIQGVRRKK